jgi:hypothetical protein
MNRVLCSLVVWRMEYLLSTSSPCDSQFLALYSSLRMRINVQSPSLDDIVVFVGKFSQFRFENV